MYTKVTERTTAPILIQGEKMKIRAEPKQIKNH